MLEGKLTYAGLAAVLIGTVFKDYISEAEAEQVIKTTIEAVGLIGQVVGIIMAAYGRFRIKRARYYSGE